MKLNRIFLCMVMAIMISLGASITLRAAIGVGPWDAFAQSGSHTIGIQVGTVGMLLNFMCVLIQLLVLKRAFKVKHALQILLSIVIGYTVNFFYYEVFAAIGELPYYARFALLLLGYVVNACTVAIVMLIDVITFPLEGACIAIARKHRKDFAKLRQAVDILSIVAAVIMTFTFDIPLAVREGTVIGMLMFGPLVGIFMNYLKPIFQRLELTDFE